jgi:cytochrome P450
MRDVEVEGVSIAAGSRVDLCLGAANRDPQRWENPDAYDMFRPAQTHIGFAIGPHQCLGMNVAKQEMITALNGLMDRFANLHLDPDAPAPRLLGGLEQRGMSALPVRLQ